DHDDELVRAWRLTIGLLQSEVILGPHILFWRTKVRHPEGKTDVTTLGKAIYTRGRRPHSKIPIGNIETVLTKLTPHEIAMVHHHNSSRIAAMTRHAGEALIRTSSGAADCENISKYRKGGELHRTHVRLRVSLQ